MRDPSPKKDHRRKDPEGAGKKKPASVIEYEEILVTPLWLRSVIYLVFAVLIGFLLLYPIFDELANDFLNFTLCIVFIGILWMLRIFLTLRVSVSSTGILFGFYLFNKRFAYEDVLDCRPFRYQLSDFLGWGIRKAVDGTVLYNVPGDRRVAVKIIVRERDQRRTYAFSAKRPEVICKRVSSHLRPVPF
ncbi:MAG: hypothetical protein AB1640_02575 [bacterium]